MWAVGAVGRPLSFLESVVIACMGCPRDACLRCRGPSLLLVSPVLCVGRLERAIQGLQSVIDAEKGSLPGGVLIANVSSMKRKKAQLAPELTGGNEVRRHVCGGGWGWAASQHA